MPIMNFLRKKSVKKLPIHNLFEKYLGKNLIKKVRDLYSKNFKT